MNSYPEPSGDKKKLEEGADFTPKFDSNGLVTAVVTDVVSGDLLMVAHMNDQALRMTLETGNAWYWSRSRGELWEKGATSGTTQRVREVRVDCDQDAIWLKVERQKREGTCHTGRDTCFYRLVSDADGTLKLKVTD